MRAWLSAIIASYRPVGGKFAVRKVRAFEGDKRLKKLLTAWVAAVDRYTSLIEPDNPWWYNERASLSTLAGAAWTINGWIALEEFATGKRAKSPSNGVESGDLRNGRCDLFLSDGYVSLAIEAKQAWQPIGSKAKGITYMKKAQREAWLDCWHLEDEADRKFAATFVVPTISLAEVRHTSESDDSCHESIRSLVTAWQAKCGDFSSTPSRRTSFAYTFPNIGEKVYSNESHCFPGVVLILEEMLPGTRRPKEG